MTDISYDRKWHVRRPRYGRGISRKLDLAHRDLLSGVGKPDQDEENPRVSFAEVIRKLEAKPAVELRIDAETLASTRGDAETRAWARLGYIIFVGLFITLIAIVVGIMNPKPLPIVVAAMGMTVVVVALWQGGRLEHAN